MPCGPDFQALCGLHPSPDLYWREVSLPFSVIAMTLFNPEAACFVFSASNHSPYSEAIAKSNYTIIGRLLTAATFFSSLALVLFRTLFCLPLAFFWKKVIPLGT